jgi:eukaryotic-like serine/threonine-protein kinase
MDSTRANRMAQELIGKTVDVWTITEKLNQGKSAVVFKAEKNREQVALKIFDPELVESFGKTTQLQRIEREKSLIGVKNPYLVQIKGGGECKHTGYLYVVMEYLPYKNLAQKLDCIPRNLISQIIGQIASSSKFLEDRGLAHRDIKPENIAISDDFQRAVLLDLGVLHPVGLSMLTDHDEQRAFLGTLQYSPPELLYRDEENTPEAWRAISFYQLGAVLHDLIMKSPIFHSYRQPFAVMVDAVREVNPKISAKDVDSQLVLLAKTCLLKDPSQRLKYLNWDRFLSQPAETENYEIKRKFIMEKQAVIRAQQGDGSTQEVESAELKLAARLQQVVNQISSNIRGVFTSDSDCFPRFESESFKGDDNHQEMIAFSFSPSPKHGLTNTLRLLIWVAIIDIDQEVISIKAKSFCDAEKLEFNKITSDGAKSIFEGPLSETVVEEQLKSILYLLMDKVLDTNIDSIDKKHSEPKRIM